MKLFYVKINAEIDQLFLYVLSALWSQGSSVSIVSDYGLDDWVIEVRSLAQARGFFL
jgi:hypothetical protein